MGEPDMSNSAEWVRATPGAFETAFPAVARRHAQAIAALGVAFDREQPLAILVGEGQLELTHVVRRFLAAADESVARITMSKIMPDVGDGLRAITSTLGFSTEGLSVGDLYSVLRLFLENQRAHRRRTIFAVEQSGSQPDWLLELLDGLVRGEIEQRYGLMIVLSDSARLLDDRLDSANLSGLKQYSRNGRVQLGAFSAAETTTFLRDRVRAAGLNDISELFDFDAIARLHSVSEGIPDDVAALCGRCLTRANLGQVSRISDADVDAVAKELDLGADRQAARLAMDSTLTGEVPAHGIVQHRLIVRLDGNWLNDRMVQSGALLIGRAEHSDIHLRSRFVSRTHALVIVTDDGHEIRDLGSRNGTFIGSKKIERHVLQPDDVIRVGQFLIEYQTIAGRVDVPAAG